MQPNERARARASDAPAEEIGQGSDDRMAQAEAILEDSDQRQEAREGSGDDVEHRTPAGDR